MDLRRTHRMASLVALTVAVSAVTATVMAALPALGSARSRSAASPLIRTGFNDGPPDIQGNNTLSHVLVHLPLGAGKYTLIAKVDLLNEDTVPERLGCELKAGGDFDLSNVIVPAAGSQLSDATIPLNVSHVFSVPGSAQLLCTTDGAAHTASASDIKITAIRAGTLSNVPIH